MDVALIENAEYEINGRNGCGDEQRLIGKSRLEFLCGSLKATCDPRRDSKFQLEIVDCIDSLAKRNADRRRERMRYARRRGWQGNGNG